MSIKKRRVRGIPHPMNIGIQPSIWLDAQDEDTITLNGSDVAQWDDKSGNGNNVAQGEANKQPLYDNSINGHNSLHFDGINDSLFRTTFTQGNWSDPMHFFAVVEFDLLVVDAATSKIFDGRDSSNRHVMEFNSGPGTPTGIRGRSIWSNLVFLESNTSPIVGVAEIWNGLFNQSNSVVRINGTQISSGAIGIDDMVGITVGSRYTDASSINGSIGELIAYEALLSNYQEKQIERYLSNKWGVTM